MKRALVFNPYFDTLGGGERYLAGVIAALNQKGYQTIVAWKDQALPQQLQNRFNIPLSALVDPEGYTIITQGNLWQKLRYQLQFDFIFWVSDGSLPLLFGRKNVVHFQVPFHHISLPWTTFLKKKFISHIVCNSLFTKQIIDQTFSVDSTIVFPPCGQMNLKKKEKIILGVGRFDGLLHSKRQDVLIEAFKKLSAPGWKLILAGGDIGTSTVVHTLQQAIGLFPVELIVNPTFDIVQDLYGKASLFWHAAGYQVNEQQNPEKVEHFGIATVEAMSAGTIPLAYDAGGQREIIQPGVNGYLWHTIDELVEKSKQIMDDEDLRRRLALKARSSSSSFNLEHFIHEFTHTTLS